MFIRLVMSLMTSLTVWIFATGKLLNQSVQNFGDLTGLRINISINKQILVRFHPRSNEREKRIFSVVRFRPNCDCKFGKINFR